MVEHLSKPQIKLWLQTFRRISSSKIDAKISHNENIVNELQRCYDEYYSINLTKIKLLDGSSSMRCYHQSL